MTDAENVISARDKEIADLEVVLTKSKDKFYNMGFTDVENSSELVMFQSRRFAAVSAMGLLEDSLFRNAEKIPYLGPPFPPVQNLTRAKDEDSQSIRALVEEIDAHAELIDLEISSDPNANQGQAP